MIAKQILVPIDFSTCSKSALRWAVDLAKGRKDTSVIVLHVIEPVVPAFDEESGVLEPEVLRTKLETVAASRNQDVQIRSEVTYGTPAESILDFAQEHQVDLIVIGTHGQGGLYRALLGSTAETVMRKAACPVLTVRDDSVTLPDEPAPDTHS